MKTIYKKPKKERVKNSFFSISRRLMILFLFATTISASAQSVVEQYGRLQKFGSNICAEDGEQITLAGASFFWSNWAGQFYTANTVDYLVDEMNISVIRAAIAVGTHGNQVSGGYHQNATGQKAMIETMVNQAVARGIYVIIDWHVEGETSHWKNDAQAFFSEMSAKYGHHPNVIYEIWNEPTDNNWHSSIRPYAVDVISSIRANDPDNLIIVGTETWSQRPDDAATNQIPDPNIAYTIHFYPDDPGNGQFHRQQLRDNVTSAMNQGAAVFATEWGPSDAAPNPHSDTWMDFLKEKKISHCMWSVNEKIADGDWQWSIFQPGTQGSGPYSLRGPGEYLKDLALNWPNRGDMNIDLPCQSIPLGGRLEAENWCKQSGFQTETTADTDGGDLNIGWTDSGDWAEYQMFVESPGNREVNFRVAADGTENKSFNLFSNGELLKTFNFQATGGWQNWVTISETVMFNSGGQTLRLEATTDGFNVNYIDFLPSTPVDIAVTGVTLEPLTGGSLTVGSSLQLVANIAPANATNQDLVWSTVDAGVASVDQNGLVTGVSSYLTTIRVHTEDGSFMDQVVVAVNNVPCSGQAVPGRIEAESFYEQEGIIAAETSIGWLDAGDWVDYYVSVNETGRYNVAFRVASEQAQENNLQFSVDGQVVSAVLSTPNTGSWGTWTDVVLQDVDLVAGCNQTLRLNVLAGATNIDYMDFVLQEAPVFTSMIISPAIVTMTEGDTLVLSVTAFDQFDNVIPNKTVQWFAIGDCITCGDGATDTLRINGWSVLGTTTFEVIDITSSLTIRAQAVVTVVEKSTERKLVWSDEFNYTGLPDPSKWGYDTGNGGFGNNELQNYTANRLENARVENGSLIVEARRDFHDGIEYSSARLVTRDKGDWLYGRVEVRAKLPGGRGSWAAIWMLPTDWEYGGWPNSGEIDIMENVGYDPNVVHGTVHTEAYNHRLGTQQGKTIVRGDYQSAFHTYAVEWDEDKVDFIMDGEVYNTFNRHGGSAEWPFDKRFHLILNLAVGGDWGGVEGVDPNIWPQRMEVDYVRVYEKSTEEQSTAIRIEAEDFSAMSGVQTEDCQEGGQNVGWIDGGDWLSFDNINIPSAGTYTVSYRVASQSNSGSFNLEGDAGATNYGNVNVNASNSNGWQDWKTVTHTVNLNAGVQSFGIGIIQGGFNFNWFEIKSAANNARSIQGNELNTVQLIESTPVSIYPNPSSDNITIDGLSDRFNQLSILGVDGKVQRVIDLTESPYIQVDVSSFKPGIFIIRLSGDNTQEIYRFVKR